jgi:hypothetical protein
MPKVTSNINVIMAELTGNVEDAIKKIVVNSTANLIETTPRDTGWARSNWIPNIGAPVNFKSGTAEQARDGNVSNAAQEVGLASVITKYKLSSGAVHITNNVPYIISLNNGSSSQAPKGFVELAIIDAIRQAS